MSIQEFLSKASKTKKKREQIAETDIESDFVKYAKKRKCQAFKLILLNLRGFPDRTILCPEGRIFFIEFKRKNKTQTPNQIKYQRILEGLGFEYYICDEKGQAENILDDFLALS